MFTRFRILIGSEGMKKRLKQSIIKIPNDIDVSIVQNKVSIRGPLGELERNFSDAPVNIRHIDAEIVIEAFWPDKKKTAMVGTVSSHIKNLMTGVLKGFMYKMKIVYAHFPMTVKIVDRKIIIENFQGERKPRIAKILGDVKVEVAGDDVMISGTNVEDVSQVAANIQQATLIKKKDPRVFLDGIYVYEKGVVP